MPYGEKIRKQIFFFNYYLSYSFFFFHFLIRSLGIAFHDVMKALMEINPSRHQSRPRRKRIRNLSLSPILFFLFFSLPFSTWTEKCTHVNHRGTERDIYYVCRFYHYTHCRAAVKLWRKKKYKREVQSLKSFLTRRRWSNKRGERETIHLKRISQKNQKSEDFHVYTHTHTHRSVWNGKTPARTHNTPKGKPPLSV